ncbi:MAG: iron ABC transporter permease [Muricomes sp.]
MVSPDLLGASAGAGFGAALGILLGLSSFIIQMLAFGTGIIAVLVTWLLHRTMGGQDTNDRILLVLSGIVTSALFQALISIVKYVADPFDTMPSIAFWLMGGLTYVTDVDVKFLLIPALAGGIPLLLVRWKLNLLTFETDEAAAMGISIRFYRGLVIFCATLMTAACVAVGGMIGWVGLIVPHFARMAVGPDYRKMLPATVIFGGVFLLLVDDMARFLFAQELPIGILTALAGAPVFALLLIRRKGEFL